MKTVGSRAQVMNGNAKKTSGGLTKAHLKYNRGGTIVSIAASNRAKKERRLEKAGYKTQKGRFVLFRRGSKSRVRKSKARKSKARRSKNRR